MTSGPRSLLAALLLAIGLGPIYHASAAEPLGVMFISRQHPEWAPLPGNVLGLPVVSLGSNGYAEVLQIQDQDINYEELQAAETGSLALGAQGATVEGGGPLAAEYGPDDLYLIISGVTNDYAYLVLHGTVDGDWYQLLSKTNLNQPGDWKPGPYFLGASGTNETVCPPVATENNAAMFFRAHHANAVVGIWTNQNAIEPNLTYGGGQTGLFWVVGTYVTGDLVVSYSISGSAQNGVDYTTLSGQVTLSPPNWSAQIEIEPFEDNWVEFDETVTLTLIQADGYLIDPSAPSGTITVSDNFGANIFVPVVTNIYHPIAIDYHAPSNSLIVSYNYDPFTAPGTNFARIYTNAGVTVVEPWSGIGGLVEEVKLATVKATANGFTNGDMYFGRDTDVGWLSADGTRSNLNWCTLTNETVANPLYIRGSLYVDQTGTFSNNLIVVTSDAGPNLGEKGVWMVGSNGSPTLLANIYTPHLEGAITLTNDMGKWGLWAGTIVTGDESVLDQNSRPRPLIYTVATNGLVAAYALGIHPEDFDIIPPGQDLYCVLYQDSAGAVLKLSRTLLADYVGCLLITDAGEFSHPARLFIVRWDNTTGSLSTRSISLPDSFGGHFEHVTFAPIELPELIP